MGLYEREKGFMSCSGFWECITPEQWVLLIAAIIGVVVAFFGALTYLIRWGANYFARVQEVKLEAMRQDIETKRIELEARIRLHDSEVQNKLDETQYNRETIRMFFSELNESRKEDANIRASYERRETTHLEAMNKIAIATQGIETNATVTLELLKIHTESDEIMSKNQEKIITQNDKTSEKLDAVIAELKTISVGRAGDRLILEDVKKKLVEIATGIKRLEDKPMVSSESEANEKSKEEKSP